MLQKFKLFFYILTFACKSIYYLLMNLCFRFTKMQAIKSILWLFVWLVVFWWCFSMAWNSLVWNLLWTQIEIWLNQRHNYSLHTDSTLSIQSDLSYWNNYDLVSELENAETEEQRLQILTQYINNLSNVISTSLTLINDEKTLSDSYEKAAKECSSQADSKNSEFSSAVKKGDYILAQKIADEIADLRACVASNQVQAKAHMTYWSSKKNISDLQKKVDYLSKNKETIAKYYEILKPDLLKELYDISQTVKVNF